MNDIQKKWTLEKCEVLLEMASSFPLSNEQTNLILEKVNHFYQLSKCNEEVKKALIDTYMYINSLDRNMRGNYAKNM